MVTVERIRDDSEKRIPRCSEGNRVWYQMWIDPGDGYYKTIFEWIFSDGIYYLSNRSLGRPLM